MTNNSYYSLIGVGIYLLIGLLFAWVALKIILKAAEVGAKNSQNAVLKLKQYAEATSEKQMLYHYYLRTSVFWFPICFGAVASVVKTTIKFKKELT